jgi:hypothetical protein
MRTYDPQDVIGSQPERAYGFNHGVLVGLLEEAESILESRIQSFEANDKGEL